MYFDCVSYFDNLFFQICPAGFYCLNNTVSPITCPPGSYCPERTEFSTQFLCPTGTYSNITGIFEKSECSSCPPGYSCEIEGLTAPSRQCYGGFFCGSGSSTPMPSDINFIITKESNSSVSCLLKQENSRNNGVCPPGNNFIQVKFINFDKK